MFCVCKRNVSLRHFFYALKTYVQWEKNDNNHFEGYILQYILNKSENATLQLSILYEKVLGKKYLLKLNNVVQQTICRNSTNLSRLMKELCSFKCLKLY